MLSLMINIYQASAVGGSVSWVLCKKLECIYMHYGSPCIAEVKLWGQVIMQKLCMKSFI